MAALDTMPANISNVGSARFAAVVTPSDSVDLAVVTRGLYVGVAGNISVNMSGNGAVVIPVQAGLHPLSVSRINSTGTTATGIVAVW